MWEEIITIAVGNGLWAVLSCALLSYLLKDSRKREQKYHGIIEALGERIKIASKIKEDTERILLVQSTECKARGENKVKSKKAASAKEQIP